MTMIPKLLGFLNRVFDKDPEPFVALVIDYAGGMTWRISDGTLETQVTGGPGTGFSVGVDDLTLAQLAAFIAGRAGYTVTYVDAERADLAASVLLEGQGDLSDANGGRLMGFSSLLWVLLDAPASQLQRAKVQIGEGLKQLSTTTAQGVWLDFLGGFYRVPRGAAEVDSSYSPRIIAETLRPTTNNIAMELAIQEFTGQPVVVTDVTIYRGIFPVHDGTILHDAAYTHSTVGLPEYGLFDVKVTFDILNSANPGAFQATVRSLVERMRAGGTHMRALDLDTSGAAIADVYGSPPTETGFSISVVHLLSDDPRDPPTDGASMDARLGVSLEADLLPPPNEVADGQAKSSLRTQVSRDVIETEVVRAPVEAVIANLFT